VTVFEFNSNALINLEYDSIESYYYALLILFVNVRVLLLLKVLLLLDDAT